MSHVVKKPQVADSCHTVYCLFSKGRSTSLSVNFTTLLCPQTDTLCFVSVPPGAPTPKVTDWSKSAVYLEWIPPLKDGGSKIIGYVVEYKEEGQEEWKKVSYHCHSLYCNL